MRPSVVIVGHVCRELPQGTLPSHHHDLHLVYCGVRLVYCGVHLINCGLHLAYCGLHLAYCGAHLVYCGPRVQKIVLHVVEQRTAATVVYQLAIGAERTAARPSRMPEVLHAMRSTPLFSG
jgi:hypothetical protein